MGFWRREHRETEENQGIVISVSEEEEETRGNRTVFCCVLWCGVEEERGRGEETKVILLLLRSCGRENAGRKEETSSVF